MDINKQKTNIRKRYRPTFQPSERFTVYLAPDLIAKIRKQAGSKKTLSAYTEEKLRTVV